MGGGEKLLSFNALFVAFRMPLFFFISGFILFKKDFEWTLLASGKFILKKAKVQLIPTLFFLAVFVYIFDMSFVDSIFDGTKEDIGLQSHCLNSSCYMCFYASFATNLDIRTALIG